jgi:polyphosphate kinase
VKLIERETARAREGQPAEIRAKMNSLTDVAIIEALYAASQAGVRIRLNVRGICALRPGVPGLSDQISVVSVVGRFLEHARIVVFHNAGDEQVFLSSADWMTRNLDHRVELLFPIEDRELAARVSEALDLLLRDAARGWVLGADGTWRLPAPAPGLSHVEAQTLLDDLAHRRAGQRADELHPLRHTDP